LSRARRSGLGSSLFDQVWRAPRCPYVGKAWWQLFAILLMFVITLIAVMVVAWLLMHAL
jgi:hypothetical protein